MLKLSKDQQLTDIISEDGSNPLTTQHPIEGSTEEVKVYLFNDNATKRYEGITAKATGTNNSWVQLARDNSGSPGAYSSEITMPDINNTSGHPVWVKVTTPKVEDTQNISTIKLTITGTEFAV